MNADPKKTVQFKEMGKKALKENQNLNLEQDYDLYLKDFTRFSEGLFDPDDNIFVERRKAMEAERVARAQPTRLKATQHTLAGGCCKDMTIEEQFRH